MQTGAVDRGERSWGCGVAAFAAAGVVVVAALAGALVVVSLLVDAGTTTEAEQEVIEATDREATCTVLGLGALAPDEWIADDGTLVLDRDVVGALALAFGGTGQESSVLDDAADAALVALTSRIETDRPRPLTAPERRAFETLTTWHARHC